MDQLARFSRGKGVARSDNLQDSSLRASKGVSDYGSANSQLPELRRRDFVGRTAMPLLRVKARHHGVPVLFRHDVHWQ